LEFRRKAVNIIVVGPEGNLAIIRGPHVFNSDGRLHCSSADIGVSSGLWQESCGYNRHENGPWQDPHSWVADRPGFYVSGAIGFETDVSALNIKRRISHVSQKTNEIKPQILILIGPQQNIIVLKYFSIL